MMLVPARVRPSKIHGLGLFAAAPIAKGTIVWQYKEPVDERFTTLDGMSPELRAFFNKHGYHPHGEDYYELCGDIANFFNHSDDPNCGDTEDHDPNFSIALRDIAAGEEMTQDYRTFNCDTMSWLGAKKE